MRGNDQRGAALITVMFVFVVAASITMAMLSRQQLDTRRTGNMFEQMQAYQYALGAEELARQVLAEDAQEVDYPGQAWGSLREGVPVERGRLRFTLEDLQGKFNLNTLQDLSGRSQERFGQLLRDLGISTEVIGAIVARMGATDAPKLYTSIQSLRSIAGISAEDFSKLAPFIAALPEGEPLLNVNTASDTVLKAYLPEEPNFSTIVRKRAVHGYLTEAELRGTGMHIRGMTVRSHYFLLTAIAEVGGRTVSLSSVIFRDKDGAGVVHERIVSRDFSKRF